MCRIGDYHRRHHIFIREGSFAKGASNTGAVVLGTLAQRAFGSGFAVPCEISK